VTGNASDRTKLLGSHANHASQYRPVLLCDWLELPTVTSCRPSRFQSQVWAGCRQVSSSTVVCVCHRKFLSTTDDTMTPEIKQGRAVQTPSLMLTGWSKATPRAPRSALMDPLSTRISQLRRTWRHDCMRHQSHEATAEELIAPRFVHKSGSYRQAFRYLVAYYVLGAGIIFGAPGL
jgi:hypothetical protein